jgi:hypothetical protein
MAQKKLSISLNAGGKTKAVKVIGQVQQMCNPSIDCDGAPNCYAPLSLEEYALDNLQNAKAPDGTWGSIYTDGSGVPWLQSEYPPNPYPIFYISMTSWKDPGNTNPFDVTKYVNAAAVNYVTWWKTAKAKGVRLNDFAAIYSCTQGTTAFAIVADAGNSTGREISLKAANSLGYPYVNGKDNPTPTPFIPTTLRGHPPTKSEIVIRYFPRSNPDAGTIFFPDQAAMDTYLNESGLVNSLDTDFSAEQTKYNSLP